MNDFTASNGVQVTYIETGDQIGMEAPRSGAESPVYTEWTGGRFAQALREFFQAEADERLGRWRWPDNPDYVIYPTANSNAVEVSNQRGGISGLLHRDGTQIDGTRVGTVFHEAARAYFDAHPEPKPWHDAAEGEVWILMFPNTSHAWFVNGDYFQSTKTLTNIAKTDPGITAGRRIFPEVS